MIIVDANQLFFLDVENMEVSLQNARTVFFDNIRKFRSKYKRQYGNMVFCFDSYDSWRKKDFPYYKANRKKSREASDIDWDKFFKNANQIKQDLKDFFPYYVIEVPHCEGDDVIAVLTEHIKTKKDSTQMVPKVEPILILSSDEDFLQLHDHSTKQISIATRKPVELKVTKERNLFWHIARGDSADGVPNILSDDDTFVNPNKRQKQLRDTKIEEWFTNGIPEDLKNRFERNKKLVDLSQVPGEYKTEIINMFETYELNNRSKIFNYFVKNGLTNLLDDIQEY